MITKGILVKIREKHEQCVYDVISRLKFMQSMNTSLYEHIRLKENSPQTVHKSSSETQI